MKTQSDALAWKSAVSELACSKGLCGSGCEPFPFFCPLELGGRHGNGNLSVWLGVALGAGLVVLLQLAVFCSGECVSALPPRPLNINQTYSMRVLPCFLWDFAAIVVSPKRTLFLLFLLFGHLEHGPFHLSRRCFLRNEADSFSMATYSLQIT